MRGLGQVGGNGPEKNSVDEAKGIRHRKGAGHHGAKRQNLFNNGTLRHEYGFCKKHFFRQKAVQQGDAGHGCRRNNRQGGGHRHGVS